ncbi:Molybdopterin biosynthesis MoaE [Thozetella sp. PMI_491]|nr:Molybdopterin biosynthesis MoaE [Thozetella sp. PMI_491]
MEAYDTSEPTEVHEGDCYVGLTSAHLNAQAIIDKVRSPQAGAIVLFAGTTRDSFDGKPVKELQYSSYQPLALRSMMAIAKAVQAKHGLKGIAIIHRLGVVPIGEESILIAVSSPHRQAAWRAGEETLEEVKATVEVWKREEFEHGGGVWRANRDGAAGVQETAPAQGQSELVWPHDGDDAEQLGTTEEGLEPMGPVIRARRPGESGHGPVVHPS